MAERAVRLRPSVREFARQMELQLRANDWKDGWQGMAWDELLGRLVEEAAELEQAILAGSPEDVSREAADVGNFAMMLANVWGPHGGTQPG